MIKNRRGEKFGGGTPKTDSIFKNGIGFYFRRDNKRLISYVEARNNKYPVVIHFDNNISGVVAKEQKDAYGIINGFDVTASFAMPSKFKPHTELIVLAIVTRLVQLGLSQKLNDEQIDEIAEYILSDK